MLLGRPFGANFCASGAHVLAYAPRRFSKLTPIDPPERILKQTVGNPIEIMRGNAP